MSRKPLSLLCGIVAASVVSAAPTPEATEVLGPFVGLDAQLHPDNRRPQLIAYGGTDLGWTYQHGGKIHFLFGDTHAGEKGDPISPVHDDTFGTIDLADWPDPTRITRAARSSLLVEQLAPFVALAGPGPFMGSTSSP